MSSASRLSSGGGSPGNSPRLGVRRFSPIHPEAVSETSLPSKRPQVRVKGREQTVDSLRRRFEEKRLSDGSPTQRPIRTPPANSRMASSRLLPKPSERTRNCDRTLGFDDSLIESVITSTSRTPSDGIKKPVQIFASTPVNKPAAAASALFNGKLNLKALKGIPELAKTGTIASSISRDDGVTLRRSPSLTPRNGQDRASVHEIRKKFQTEEGANTLSRTSMPKLSPVRLTGYTRQEETAPVRPQRETSKADKPKPPRKPPRTFAHDVYVQEKKELKYLVDSKYRRISRHPKKESGDKSHRRSRSVDHIYEEPFKISSDPRVHSPENVRLSPIIKLVEPYHVSSLIGKEPMDVKHQSAVREIIKHSFCVLRKLGRTKSNENLAEAANNESADSESEVSLKDVQERITYAQTLKKIYAQTLTLSHYASVSDIATDNIWLCKKFMIYNKTKGEMEMEFPNNSVVSELVSKFCKTCAGTTDNQFFWFSFTTQRDRFLYAYCLAQKSRVITLSSELCSPQLFSLILNIYGEKETIDRRAMVEVTEKKIPLPGDILVLSDTEVKVPWDGQITSIQSSKLLALLEPEIVVKSIATMIHERRVVLVSKDPNVLIESSKTMVSFLYPLSWDYMCWPVVPTEYVTFCAALDTPYIVGVAAKDAEDFLEAAAKRDEKLLVINLDTNSVMLAVGDEERILPSKYYQAVKTALNLSQNMTDPTGSLRDVVISEAFLQMFIELLGSATAYISENFFKKEMFIRCSGSRNVQVFLQWFCETRLFECFVKYWQLRCHFYQFLPLSNKVQSMGAFERRTQQMRTFSRNGCQSRDKTPKSPKTPTSIQGNVKPAVKGLERRVRMISEKFKKAF